MKKIATFITGIIVGIAFACSGGGGLGGITPSIADTIGKAVDVVFDNTDSGLVAINVQGAIDELAARNSFESVSLSGTTWKFSDGTAITFNADKTFTTITGTGGDIEALCASGGTYSDLNSILVFDCGDFKRIYSKAEKDGSMYLVFISHNLPNKGSQ